MLAYVELERIKNDQHIRIGIYISFRRYFFHGRLEARALSYINVVPFQFSGYNAK